MQANTVAINAVAIQGTARTMRPRNMTRASNHSSARLVTPPVASFNVLRRQPTSADLEASRAAAAIGKTPDLSDSRLLASTHGDRFLLAPQASGGLCLHVVQTAGVAGGAWNNHSSTSALWLEYETSHHGVPATNSKISMVVPEAYSNATASTDDKILYRSPNLIVLAAHPGVNRVALISKTYTAYQIKVTTP